MRTLYINMLLGLITCLEFISSPCVSIGYDVVYPELLEEYDDGELLVAIRAGQNLTLRRASVIREELEVTTFEDDTRIVQCMNGTRMEHDIYYDRLAFASVLVTRSGGLRLEGILGPSERIQPSGPQPYDAGGLVEHHIMPILLEGSDIDYSSDKGLQGTEFYSKSTSPNAHTQTGSTVLTERSGSSIYPIKATCETRFLVDTSYFEAFNQDKERLVKYLSVLTAYVNLKFSTLRADIVQLSVLVTGIVILSLTAFHWVKKLRSYNPDLTSDHQLHCRRICEAANANYGAFFPSSGEDTKKSQESFIEEYDKDDSIMLAKTLDHLNGFVQKQSLFMEDDAVVFLTGLDLSVVYGDPPIVSTDIVGLAEPRGACGSKKAAIVEDMLRTFASAHTMAHEMGHLLGSYHDGATLPPNSPIRVDPRTCPPGDKHIMSPILGRNMKPDFSYCSSGQIADFLLADEAKCLTTASPRTTKKLRFDDVNATRPTLDEICEKEHPDLPGTRYVGGKEQCVIFCSHPQNPQLQAMHDAPDGTPCNDEKPRMVCLNGQCAYVRDVRESNHVRTFDFNASSVVELT